MTSRLWHEMTRDGFINAFTPQNHRTPPRHKASSRRLLSVFLWPFCVSVVSSGV